MKNRALKYTLILILIGIIITALMAFLVWMPRSVQQRNTPFLALGVQVKKEVTQTMPLFEKVVAGDASVNFNTQVLAPITTSGNLVQKAYDGVESELGSFEKID